MKRLYEKLLSAVAIAAIAVPAMAVKINVADINNFNAAVNALIAAGPTGVPTSRQILAGTGLTGGGDLTADRTLSIATSGVTAGTYGDATHTGAFTVNALGQITSATSTAITFPTSVSGNAGTATKLATARTIDTLTGDVTTPGCSFDGTAVCTNTATLASVGTAGTYGDATHIPSVTTDAKGRVTGVTLNAITIPTGTLLAANNLSDVANATTSRTNLGLGTGAVANTGTSGHTIPYLDTANVFSGTGTTFANTVTITAGGLVMSGPLISTTLGGTTQGQITVNSEAANFNAVASFTAATYASIGSGSNFTLEHARGTVAAPADVVQNDQMGQLVFWGYAGGAFRAVSKITATVMEPTPSATALGSNFSIFTTPLGTIAPKVSTTFQSDQSVTFANTINLPFVTINTDAGATYTLAASASYTQYLSAPITANRAVTLPTTTQNGQVFRFIRAVASTGSFTWSIGGLKSLAAGTWCDVQWNGSAWIEIAYGAL